MIKRDHLPSEFPGSSARYRRDHGTESQAFSSRCDGAKHDPGVHERNVRTPIKQNMIPDEKAVPTGLLGIERECEQILRIAVLAEILDVYPEMHSSTPRHKTLEAP